MSQDNEVKMMFIQFASLIRGKTLIKGYVQVITVISISGNLKWIH